MKSQLIAPRDGKPRRAPILGSGAQLGTSPYRSFTAVRSDSSSRVDTKICVGHPLYRGWRFNGVVRAGIRYSVCTSRQDIFCVNAHTSHARPGKGLAARGKASGCSTLTSHSVVVTLSMSRAMVCPTRSAAASTSPSPTCV